MSAADVAVLVAAVCAALAATGTVVACVILTRRIRELRSMVEGLDRETVPMLRDARIAADQAATELVRVGDVLASAEAVSTTVDSASRLAYRAFANPLVKSVAFFSGLGGALRRLFGRPDAGAGRPRRATVRPQVLPATPVRVAGTATGRHRRGRRGLAAKR